MSALGVGDKVNFNYGHVKLDFLGSIRGSRIVERFHASDRVPDSHGHRTRRLLLLLRFNNHFADRILKSIIHFTDVLSPQTARRVQIPMITGCVCVQQVAPTPF